ncbi:unnamed protein product [Gongylonema pulchrum]|uniref:Uncharacterized protein n=1 Tax=Gongylonema pulchrum TaxID=637853 RepID=A0A183CW16_9BILA|nr:unnamed protein product [Gongylonema pulchrum]
MLLKHNAPEWPVPPSSAYTMMAAQCAGSYSMGTVATIEHISSECGRLCDHHHHHHDRQNIQTVLSRNGDGGDTALRPIARHCYSVGASPCKIVDRGPAGDGLPASAVSLLPTQQKQQQQRAVSFPYGTGSDYGQTYFGTAPHHITVATIDDEPPSPPKTVMKAILRPSNKQTAEVAAAESSSGVSLKQQQQQKPNYSLVNTQILTVSDLEMNASGSCDF